MLVPNNINIYGRLSSARDLDHYWVKLEFPRENAIAYVKEPASSMLDGDRRKLTYRLGSLINFDDYWWHPLQGETDFSLKLNMLPPFPRLNPLDLQIACKPDIAVGLETDVTTHVRVAAEERIDSLFIRHTAPRFVSPGISIEISKYSGDDLGGPRQSVTTPKERYPIETLSLSPGESREYRVETRIRANPKQMAQLKCQQSLLTTKIVALSNSTPEGPPCDVSIVDDDGNAMPIRRTVRSTVLQASAEIMHSPFSLQQDPSEPRPRVLVKTPAT